MKIEIIPNEQTPSVPFIKNVDKWIGEHKELIESCLNFIKNKDHAIGLAANQASVDGERCMERFFLEKDVHTKEWEVIINPKIVENLGFAEGCVEGCLTWQEKDVIAYRYRRIKVDYYTIGGEYKEETIIQFRSHVWQHELGHLDGVEERVETPGSVWFTNRELQRNELCPCGSGKKYKKCCLPFEITDYSLPRSLMSPEYKK